MFCLIASKAQLLQRRARTARTTSLPWCQQYPCVLIAVPSRAHLAPCSAPIDEALLASAASSPTRWASRPAALRSDMMAKLHTKLWPSALCVASSWLCVWSGTGQHASAPQWLVRELINSLVHATSASP